MEDCSKYPYKLHKNMFSENSLGRCFLDYTDVCELDLENTTTCGNCSMKHSVEG